MWINNTDREVECFHPVCKEALEKALEQLGLNDKYIVQHHRHIGSIEMDLVVANKESDRILCVIEVKRTVAAVNSTRYQYQAMSYVQSLPEAELESTYYMLTDLEASCLFRYDSDRKNVYEQILQPGIVKNHLFSEGIERGEFIESLSRQYADFLKQAIDDSGKYLLSFKQFADELNGAKTNSLLWKKTLVSLFYEYIRGSFTTIGRKSLKSIGQLSQKLDLVCREGLKVDFKDIFTLPHLAANERNINTRLPLLEQLFELGRTYVDADELASVMHRVISSGHEHEGEVPTDSELANVLLWLVKEVGGNLGKDEKIMDPAAGGGSLLCAAIDVFKNLSPQQLIANDVNPLLLQLLSLRLGLKFAKTISPNDTVSITSKDIADIDSSVFDGVKFLVMNPPFLAATGNRCIERKAKLYKRIREIKNSEPTTSKGQMPLEGVFLELASVLAKEGTVIGAIIPNTHLTTKGEASVAIRQMLLKDFGLQLIFSYPQENLFESVSQNTSIVIGVKGKKCKNIKYMHSNNAISDIDPTTISGILSRNFNNGKMKTLTNDFDGCSIPFESLSATIEDGWMIGNITQQETRNFLNSHINVLPVMNRICDSEFKDFYRGQIGNNGCTALMFLKRNNPFIEEEGQNIKDHLTNGFNKADSDKYDIGTSDTTFLNTNGMSDKQLKMIVTDFMKEENGKRKKQRRDNKSVDEYMNVMRKDSSILASPANSVVLPRSIRSQGRVFITSKPTHISTNFFVFETDAEKARILSSWMSTVFFQLECEAYGNNRKGLRKMERADYSQMHIPDTSKLTSKDKSKILNASVVPFLNLRQPEPRPVDRLWATILFGDRGIEVLNEATDQLAILVAARER